MEINTLSRLDANLADEAQEYLKNYNDTTTLVAEMLDGQMRSSFEFSFDGQDLISEEGGSMKQIFELALNDAREMAQYDSRLNFEVDRRQKELDEFRLMVDMANGCSPNTMIVISEVPADVLAMNQNMAGYNIKRQKAMLRVISRLPSGKIKVESQSLDRSDSDGFKSIYHRFGVDPDLTRSLLDQRLHVDLSSSEQTNLADNLTSSYDQALSNKYGGQWYAGRSQADKRNTYDFVCSQTDVIDHFITTHSGSDITDQDLYNLVAYLEKRFSGEELHHDYAAGTSSLAVEIKEAGDSARQIGKSYDGCGVSLGAGNNSNGESFLEKLGYSSRYKKMNCPFCKSAVWGDPCSDHHKCNSCKAEVRNGKVINKGDSGKQNERVKKVGKKIMNIMEWLFSKDNPKPKKK